MMQLVMTAVAVKTCKSLVKLSPPTNQHPFFKLDALPVTLPTVSKH